MLMTPEHLKTINELLARASGDAVTLNELRHACAPTIVRLNDDAAATLGATTRRKTPILQRVVDAIAGKLFLDVEKFSAETLGTASIAKAAKEWVSTWQMAERDLFKAVVRDGRAYLHVSWDSGRPRYTVRPAYGPQPILHRDPATGQTHTTSAGAALIRNPSTLQPEVAINAWQVDQITYIDLYYADRVEKYAKTATGLEGRIDAPDEAWPLPWTDSAGVPLGVALIEFSVGESAVLGGLQTARDINEAQLDVVAGSRTQGWPQRYLIGQRDPDVIVNELGQPLLNGYGKPVMRKLSPAPGSFLRFRENTTVGQLESAQPNSAAIAELWGILSYITTVPVFRMRDGGEMPSGVALIQAEAALNHRAEEYQGYLSNGIEQLLRLSIRLSNQFGGTSLPADRSMSVPWATPEIYTIDLQEALENGRQTRILARYEAGVVSLEEAVKQTNPTWTPEQIAIEVVRIRADRPAVAPAPPQTPVKSSKSSKPSEKNNAT